VKIARQAGMPGRQTGRQTGRQAGRQAGEDRARGDRQTGKPAKPGCPSSFSWSSSFSGTGWDAIPEGYQQLGRHAGHASRLAGHAGRQAGRQAMQAGRQAGRQVGR
jgi:hypothetical protein